MDIVLYCMVLVFDIGLKKCHVHKVYGTIILTYFSSVENLLKIGLAEIIVPYTKGLLKCTLEIENRIRGDTLALRPSSAERRPHGQNVSLNLISCFLV